MDSPINTFQTSDDYEKTQTEKLKNGVKCKKVQNISAHLANLQEMVPPVAISSNSDHRKITKRIKSAIIDVPGCRIVRSTSRKDRHSKVCTSKGLKDRRLRLSPGTAIEFYDVQDRLGFDRPSKAIDWLMKEAKAAIDALDVDVNQILKTQEMEQGSEFNSAELTQIHTLNFDSNNPISSFSEFANHEEDSLIYSNKQQLFDSNLEMGKLQRIFTNAGTEFSFMNSLPLNLSKNQIFSEREFLQSNFISHSPIDAEFYGINFYSEEFSDGRR